MTEYSRWLSTNNRWSNSSVVGGNWRLIELNTLMRIAIFYEAISNWYSKESVWSKLMAKYLHFCDLRTTKGLKNNIQSFGIIRFLVGFRWDRDEIGFFGVWIKLMAVDAIFQRCDVILSIYLSGGCFDSTNDFMLWCLLRWKKKDQWQLVDQNHRKDKEKTLEMSGKTAWTPIAPSVSLHFCSAKKTTWVLISFSNPICK